MNWMVVYKVRHMQLTSTEARQKRSEMRYVVGQYGSNSLSVKTCRGRCGLFR